MKKYESVRMAVLIQLMSEITGSQEGVILEALQGHCIDEEDAGAIKRELDEIQE